MELPGYYLLISAEDARGISPRTWIAVGPGFAREEIKALLLSNGAPLGTLSRAAITSEAVTSAEEIAARLLGGISAEARLDTAGRQEALRHLFSDRRIMGHLPELVRRRRGGLSFWRRLDRSIQAARLLFASPGEEEALHERLESDGAQAAPAALRSEIRLLAGAYETWLSAKGLWDTPLLFRAAISRLEERGWPEGLRKPERILHLTGQAPESLENSFWETVSREVPVERLGPLNPTTEQEGLAPNFRWERWHTVDDAAERLAELLAKEPDRLARDAVLIPDNVSVRRSLKRALKRHGIPEADGRDPDLLKFDERVKWGLLPLRLVSGRFERELVLSWISQFGSAEPSGALWAEEIASRAIQGGLDSYAGGKLEPLYARLVALQKSMGGKTTHVRLSEAHLACLALAAGGSPERAWAVPIFEKLWQELALDEKRVWGELERRAPTLYWLNRLEARLAETPSPPLREKRENGLRVYRMHQAPLVGAERIYALGLPSDWLSGGDPARGGSYWIGSRDRERLAGTGFAVRSAIQLREERLATGQAWCSMASDIHFLDAAYEEDGRERESIAPVLEALLGAPLDPVAKPLPEPLECGAHSRWRGSYSPVPLLAPSPIRLGSMLDFSLGLPPTTGADLPKISATTLDHYSRCPFQALVFDRWRLRDLREPDYDLWPEVKGILLHEAVRLIVASRDPEDESFALTPREALDHAWKITGRGPRGLFKSRRAEEHAKERLVRVLDLFLEKEREYLARTQAKQVALDQMELRLEVPGEFALVGKPDRIDETADGLFIIDYKTTSSGLPNAEDLLGLGYRLQLPLYALASEAKLGKPAIGLQFISLSRTGSRGSGLFFKRFNGKEAGKLTNVRSNSKSLVTREPDEVWSELKARIVGEARGFASGRFDPAPKKGEKECLSCSAADVCGYSRREMLSDEAPA